MEMPVASRMCELVLLFPMCSLEVAFPILTKIREEMKRKFSEHAHTHKILSMTISITYFSSLPLFIIGSFINHNSVL